MIGRLNRIWFNEKTNLRWFLQNLAKEEKIDGSCWQESQDTVSWFLLCCTSLMHVMPKYTCMADWLPLFFFVRLPFWCSTVLGLQVCLEKIMWTWSRRTFMGVVPSNLLEYIESVSVVLQYYCLYNELTKKASGLYYISCWTFFSI